MATTQTKRNDVLISLPREGYEVWACAYFDELGEEKRHEYRRVNDKGKPGLTFPGCSTIGKAFPDRPDGLMYWAERETLRGVALLNESGDFSGFTDPFALKGELHNHGLRWHQLRDSAAERGKQIHRDVLEALARGDEIPDLGDLPPERRGYGQAVLKWWHDRQPQPRYTEQVVLSLEHGYAGRSDFIGWLGNAVDPFMGNGILDLKTGNGIRQRDGSICMPRADHIQIKGYELAALECGLLTEPADWLMLLQVCPDGTYREHVACAEEADFHLALKSHKAAYALDKRMIPLP